MESFVTDDAEDEREVDDDDVVRFFLPLFAGWEHSVPTDGGVEVVRGKTPFGYSSSS